MSFESVGFTIRVTLLPAPVLLLSFAMRALNLCVESSRMRVCARICA